jgi:hypothetical protein
MSYRFRLRQGERFGDERVTNVAAFGLQTPASSTTRRELLIMNAAFLLSRLWSVMTSVITR